LYHYCEWLNERGRKSPLLLRNDKERPYNEID
jgi:hypothetical protein